MFFKFLSDNSYNDTGWVNAFHKLCLLDNIKRYGKSIQTPYRFHTGGKTNKLYCDTPDIEKTVIIQNRTNGSGKCNLFLDKNCSVAGQTLVYYSDNENITKFIYYYLKCNIDH